MKQGRAERFVFVNHPFETFTPTQSGAVASVIHHCCSEAALEGREAVVITRPSGAPPYEGTRIIWLPYPAMPEGQAAEFAMRAHRKILGYRHLRHGAYIRSVLRTIRQNRLEEATILVHNEPELAVTIAEELRGCRLVAWFHNQQECKTRFRRRLGALVSRVVAVSDFTARWVERYYDMPPGAVRTAYNGVDTGHFCPASTPTEGLLTVNFLGRTGIEKGPDLLLDAALRLAGKAPPFAIQLLGSNHWDRLEVDDFQRGLASKAEALERRGVPVRRPGHVSRAELPGELRRAQIHVAPARWAEPFGMATLEGMACGLATVASRAGGTPEVVGKAGLLFEPGSVPELARCVQQLIENATVRQSLGAAARQRAEEFTWAGCWRAVRRAAEID